MTVQKTCERLIKEGARIAGSEELRVVHVVQPGQTVLGGSSEGEALDYLYRVSRAHGAEMDMLRAKDVLGTIVAFAKEMDAGYVVIGAAKGHSRMAMDRKLAEQLPEATLVVVP